jgi:hypothetical protein
LALGQLAVAQYGGKTIWSLTACGVFAAVVLAYFDEQWRAA